MTGVWEVGGRLWWEGGVGVCTVQRLVVIKHSCASPPLNRSRDGAIAIDTGCSTGQLCGGRS